VDVQELLTQARNSVTVRRVFGEPYERNGITVIPAAFISGGGGGGSSEGGGEAPAGGGGGFGVMAWPVGAFVIRGDDVRWQSAVNTNFVVWMGAMVLLAVLKTRRVSVRARARRRRDD
jgi:uncharacterized spore protein YtfJ